MTNLDDRNGSTAAVLAAHLLAALRRAGCHGFIDAEDQQFYCSPPARHIEWPDDPEAAIEEHYGALQALVSAERLTIH